MYGFGELTNQQNAKSQITHLIYHDDGRLNQKILSVEGTTTYTYNTNKQLICISSPGAVSRTYGYDTKGRMINTTDSIPGSSPFTTSIGFDDIGRVSTITHPSGIVETKNYNSSGYLSSISAGGSTRWTTSGMNARQQVTAGHFLNNLNATFGYDSYGFPTSVAVDTIQNYSFNFDPVSGNLNWRQNNKHSNLRESFYYDNLDRLDSIRMGTTTKLKMAYDGDKGGITTKSDVGTLLYENSGKPYAVSSINPSTGLIPSARDSINYTSFEKISSIFENNNSATFLYNSDNERSRMIVVDSSGTILTRWYPSDSYIKETQGSITKAYTFVGGDAYTAPVVAVTKNDTTIYYDILRDYLGNITHIVNSTNNSVVAEYSYDAWGRMRNPSSWENYAPGSEPPLFIAGRGFTGHEHLPWFNLINMNGRGYDPYIGQFLSPDPVVQSPTNSQSYNRYSYCLNNPLLYIDPSGYTWLSHFGGWLISIGKDVIILTAGIVTVAYILAVSFVGAVSGMVVGSLITANPLGSTIGGVAGGVLGFIQGAKTGFKAVGKFEKFVKSW